MSYVFVDDDGAYIGCEGNCITIKKRDGEIRRVPIETVEAIYLFSSVQMTSQCVIQCLKRGINVSYYSKGGEYFGRLQSTNHINVLRQRKQAKLADTEFSINIAKKIIKGKIHNQAVVLRRYSRSKDIKVDNELLVMKQAFYKIDNAQKVPEIMGYEGMAAKSYFLALDRLIDEKFHFKGRSKQPPKDEFNSLLSLGYTILMNEMYSKIENKGLNPYFGFIHSDRERHPTLVSDMIEEWRAVIVDSLVMSMINGHEIMVDDFYCDNNNPGYFLNKNGMKKFLLKFERKLCTEMKYLEYINYAVDFRHAIDLQISQLVKAVEEEDYNIYTPIYLR